MLLSYRHKFIFMHCPKTGGSAVTVSLARLLGPRDIQIGGHEDTLEHGIWPSAATVARIGKTRGLRSFTKTLLRSRSLPKAFNTGVKATYPDFSSAGHPSAAQIRDVYPDEWSRFFKFSIVRNPFDRLVSYYHWRTKGLATEISFSDFVVAACEERSIAGVDMSFFDTWKTIAIDDGVALNRIMRYERLQDDLAEAMREAGVPWDGWLPRVKVSANRSAYRQYYSDADAERVATRYGREIEMFGYEF